MLCELCEAKLPDDIFFFFKVSWPLYGLLKTQRAARIFVLKSHNSDPSFNEFINGHHGKNAFTEVNFVTPLRAPGGCALPDSAACCRRPAANSGTTKHCSERHRWRRAARQIALYSSDKVNHQTLYSAVYVMHELLFYPAFREKKKKKKAIKEPCSRRPQRWCTAHGLCVTLRWHTDTLPRIDTRSSRQPGAIWHSSCFRRPQRGWACV